jgi:hypothetical protein
LKLVHKNGMHLSMKSSHEMHRLLARGVEEVTDDSKVRSFCYIAVIPCSS